MTDLTAEEKTCLLATFLHRDNPGPTARTVARLLHGDEERQQEIRYVTFASLHRKGLVRVDRNGMYRITDEGKKYL